MAPEIMPGDIAYIQPCFIYHPFMEQNLGRDLFGVRLDAGDAVGTSLKRCCVQSNLLIFYSNNVKYSPVILDMKQNPFRPADRQGRLHLEELSGQRHAGAHSGGRR